MIDFDDNKIISFTINSQTVAISEFTELSLEHKKIIRRKIK